MLIPHICEFTYLFASFINIVRQTCWSHHGIGEIKNLNEKIKLDFHIDASFLKCRSEDLGGPSWGS